jgi:anaphase-promoting complex subunit 2
VELLKIRFGESRLHLCEVMLKDFANSKRVNTSILSRKTQCAQCCRCRSKKCHI